MDKEPDGVVVYANADSCNPNQGIVSEPLLDSVSRDDVNGNTELHYTEENIEVKEYDVKECTSEIPVGKSTGNDYDHQSKDVAKSVLPAKNASKTGRGSNKTRNTVPQPFSLATEKRASSTRSFTVESLEAAMSKKFPDGHRQSHATKVRIYAISLIFTIESLLICLIVTPKYLFVIVGT